VSERLPLSVIWAFSVPRIGISFMGVLFVLYLMKYSTDVLLIPPAAMGTLFLISRVWDGISDPLAGYLSDRTRSRHGRRRSWMFAAALPTGIGMVMLWSPPAALGGAALVAWMGLALLVYETASTAFFIPHGALGAELTQDHHERTRLFGLGHLIGAIGMGLGLGLFWVLTNAEDQRATAFLLSSVGGACVAGLILWSTWRLPERRDYQGRGGRLMMSSFRDVARNPHSRLLLLVYGIETFGVASIAMLVPYVVQYVLGMPLTATTGVMACYLVPQFLFVPLWIRLAPRFGKKKLWLASMVATGLAFLALFAVTPETPLLIYLLPVFLGVAAGCGAVVAPSVQADIIDYDEYLTDERKEGAYLAVWNFVRKSAGGLMALLTGFVLQASGFEPNVEQSEGARMAIRVLFSLVPAACYFLGALAFARFSLGEEEHRRVLAEISARRGGAAG
jgi:GPH family glycoside/pentoside/hexuronide:cation symporter